MQRDDFIEMFEIMEGLPVTIRLLDPPLHEFLPHTEEEMHAVAEAIGLPVEGLWQRAKELLNPTRCWAIAAAAWGSPIPEIYEMQARAISSAGAGGKGNRRQTGRRGDDPAGGHRKELELDPESRGSNGSPMTWIAKAAAPKYLIGTMIELPRAALRAGEIAQHAEFFSFGTNDLTQTTFGLSRDDAGKFLTDYLEGHFRERPVRFARSGRGRRSGQDRRRARSRHPSRT
jgi:pyruvate,orthophosphate dikinase